MYLMNGYLVFKVHGGAGNPLTPYYNIQGPKANLFFEKFKEIFYRPKQGAKNQDVKLTPWFAKAGQKESPKQTKACADWHTPLFNYFAFLWHIPVYVWGVPKNSFVAFRTFGHKKIMAIRFGMVRRPRAMS